MTVKEEGSKDGYGRERFGSAWADVDGNSCGTRDDILKRDLAEVEYKDGDDCVVASGVLKDDPYSGEDVEFRRGASKVDIDHLVSLSDAWKKGASEWECGQAHSLRQRSAQPPRGQREPQPRQGRR